MFKYTAGFVGAGHMGGILAKVVIKSSGGENVAVACRSEEKTVTVAERLGCRPASADVIIKESEFIFLGMRPGQLNEFVENNKTAIEMAEGTFVSMLSGVSIDKLEEKLGTDKSIIRIMPNTPCEIGKGLIGYVCGSNISRDKEQKLKTLLAPAGLVEGIAENEMDIFSVIAACAPAYTYFFADALAKGGEKCGMDREKAIKYVAQMLMGSAGMMLEGDKTPEALKNEVCTPGGTTIEGVNTLENGGLESLVVQAVKSSYNKTVGK